MITLRLRDYLAGERLQRDTRRYLRRLRELPVLRSRETTSALLRWLRAQPGPHVRLGTTAWDETVSVPLLELVKACGLTTGGMGSGKTMFALLPIRAMIRLLPGLRTMSFGVVSGRTVMRQSANLVVSSLERARILAVIALDPKVRGAM